MERSIGRQGPMMSPGMSRRPGGMLPRDSYQTHSYHQQQQQQQQTSPHQHHQQQQQQQPSQQLVQQSPSQFQHSQHDELIRYINEAWNSIMQDKSQTPPVFYKGVPEPRLASFTPFDLEAWWGRRLVHKINISTHGHQ
ncbi:GATA zinc finger domain-containing protein 10 [Wyeomyia smithii]|uniref:GATA zinc finger domain-containing protein 10 n=1 Tax=Wyeomyia smithii TaxID=174621 RepID=UPI002467EA72|nr:GATA zinc finger domain-containing protein 10 [Wyeomyia smithii]